MVVSSKGNITSLGSWLEVGIGGGGGIFFFFYVYLGSFSLALTQPQFASTDPGRWCLIKSSASKTSRQVWKHQSWASAVLLWLCRRSVLGVISLGCFQRPLILAALPLAADVTVRRKLLLDVSDSILLSTEENQLRRVLQKLVAEKNSGRE